MYGIKLVQQRMRVVATRLIIQCMHGGMQRVKMPGIVIAAYHHSCLAASTFKLWIDDAGLPLQTYIVWTQH